MFDLLAKITNEGETFQISYERTAAGQVRLLVQPRLNDDPDTVTDEAAQKARAALSRPVVFTGTHAEVEAQFTQYVQGNGDARGALKDAYDTLTERTKQAAKAAAQAAADKGKDKPKAKPAAEAESTKAADATAEAEAKPADDGKQPTNLFD